MIDPTRPGWQGEHEKLRGALTAEWERMLEELEGLEVALLIPPPALDWSFMSAFGSMTEQQKLAHQTFRAWYVDYELYGRRICELLTWSAKRGFKLLDRIRERALDFLRRTGRWKEVGDLPYLPEPYTFRSGHHAKHELDIAGWVHAHIEETERMRNIS